VSQAAHWAASTPSATVCRRLRIAELDALRAIEHAVGRQLAHEVM